MPAVEINSSSSSFLIASLATIIESIIFLYPVHLQRLGVNAFSISPRLGSAFRLMSASACITIPGIQKPHCTPPALTKAVANIVLRYQLIPSSVSTCFPTTSFIFLAHASTALSSSCTTQQPHAACGEHPSLGDVTLRSSLK